MSTQVREELLPRMRQRYMSRNKAGKGQIIDELCAQFDYTRKHAIKLLGAKSGWGGDPKVRKGRPALYDEGDREVLHKIWKNAEQPCGKRMVALLPQWLGYYEQEYGKVPEERLKRLQRISAAQVDRLLARHKVAERRGRCGTKPGGLLKHQIPIRTDNWDITKPGFLEADTVAHCGGSLEGSFVWSVTFTDIHSGWTANRAVWNKGAAGIVAATREVEAKLPFAILGFDCDNGSEFLNHHLVNYFCERKTPVGFTRSRPFHKDDNGHVEQKNWTHVRQLFQYYRIEDPELLDQINTIYRDIWEPFHNFFSPSAKLIKKTRNGAQIKRRHDKPKTPCDRLLESPDITEEAKNILRETREKLNPFDLQRKLNAALAPILQRCTKQPRNNYEKCLSSEKINDNSPKLTTVS